MINKQDVSLHRFARIYQKYGVTYDNAIIATLFATLFVMMLILHQNDFTGILFSYFVFMVGMTCIDRLKEAQAAKIHSILNKTNTISI